MEDIILPAAYGDEKRTLALSPVSGAGQVLHIMVDNWYHGQIVLVKEEWVVFLNPKSDLCSNDIQVIKEAIEGSCKKY